MPPLVPKRPAKRNTLFGMELQEFLIIRRQRVVLVLVKASDRNNAYESIIQIDMTQEKGVRLAKDDNGIPMNVGWAVGGRLI